MNVAIRAENLGKRYLIRHEQGPRYATLRDGLMEGLRALGGRRAAPEKEWFWALQEAGFEIGVGERVGIIGGNGAGKSTLLKLLARITAPTMGRVTIRGRVASLLEVGTGFHPELSGRENIFLNGAILGMGRREISRSFDQIVAFAEIGRFLDTPVKRYSSGMYTRLAFSIAAHLQTDILLVDEILAVGDINFQKKCLTKLDTLGKGGRTIVFVSHNLSQIQRLCTRGIVLRGGAVSFLGDVSTAIERYVSSVGALGELGWNAASSGDRKFHNEVLKPLKLQVVNGAGELLGCVDRASGRDVFVVFEFNLPEMIPDLTLGYSLFDERGNHIYRTLHSDGSEQDRPVLRLGRNELRSRLPVELLNEGRHTVVLDGGIHKKRWLFNPELDKVVSTAFEMFGRETDSEYWQTKRMGVIAPLLNWEQRS